MTALCGLSGAGKSTVAALLERFYEPTEGSIHLDNTPLSEVDPSWLRGNVIGFINQEPVLFATTVMENIRYGSPAASDEEVSPVHTYIHYCTYTYYNCVFLHKNMVDRLCTTVIMLTKLRMV